MRKRCRWDVRFRDDGSGFNCWIWLRFADNPAGEQGYVNHGFESLFSSQVGGLSNAETFAACTRRALSELD